jgi:hypothetical protein
MVTQTYRTTEEETEPVHVWAPMCRDIALALVMAHTERFSDWDSDRVVAVRPHTDA